MEAQSHSHSELLRIVSVHPLANYHVRVHLTDNSDRVLDLRPHLKGEFLKPLLDPELFRQVEVDHGTLSWPTGEDLDPDVLLSNDVALRVASRWIKAMPCICQFDGIKIYMYVEDHVPPHVHAEYSGDEALIRIIDGGIHKGAIRAAQLKSVQRWLDLRRDEVNAAWIKAASGQNPGKVPPP